MATTGTLATVAVHAGDQVHKGQVLATLNSTADEIALQTAQANLAMASAKKKLVDVQALAARTFAHRVSAAAKAGAGSGQDADTAQAAVAQLEARQGTAKAAIAIAQSNVKAARYALTRDTLRAPLAAYVVHVLAQPGASVSPQSPVFTLLPNRPLMVRAELNAAYVDDVRPGMRAEVSIDGAPASEFRTARVVRIGKVFGVNTLNDNPGRVAYTRTVDCTLAFDKPPPWRVGQHVLVRFLPASGGTKG